MRLEYLKSTGSHTKAVLLIILESIELQIILESIELQLMLESIELQWKNVRNAGRDQKQNNK